MILMTVTHFFDYLHTFIEYKPSTILLLTYFIHRIPEWILTVLPIAALLGTLFSIGSLNRAREITAVRSSGIRLLNIIIPIIVFSFLISLCSVYLHCMIVPKTTKLSEELFLKIKKRNIKKNKVNRKNFAFIGQNKNFYSVTEYDYKTDKIIGLRIMEFFPNSTRQKKLITAESAEFIGKKWEMLNVTIRDFNENSNSISFNKFDSKVIDIPEKPSHFRQPDIKPDNMTVIELKNFINKLKASGFSSIKEVVLYYHRFSYSLTTFIITLFGIPLALMNFSNSRAISFFVSLITCFIYWGMISIGQALASGGTLPPAIGVWAANIVFLIISILFYRSVRII